MCSFARVTSADEPILRIEADGPVANVTGLGFSADGKSLYAAGWDKVIHVWAREHVTAPFDYARHRVLRVPIGPGVLGSLNALAVSPDHRWIAVAGRAMARNMAGFRHSGKIWPAPAMTDDMQLDVGTIHVFELGTGRVISLRGHSGPVQAMTFVRGSTPGQPYLISAGIEEADDVAPAAVRVWDVAKERQYHKLGKLPALTGWRPGLSGWWSDSNLRTAIAWGDQENGKGIFRVWDVTGGTLATHRGLATPLLADLISTGERGRNDEVLASGDGVLGIMSVRSSVGGNLAQLQDGDFRAVATKLQARPVAAAIASHSKRAVVVTVAPRGDEFEYRLAVIDLERRGMIGESTRLWVGRLKTATVAITPDGRQVAIAGHTSNDVRFYDISNPLQLKTATDGTVEPVQVLHGTGVAGRTIEFVVKDKSLGLRLGLDVNGGSVVFDIKDRGTVADPRAWQSSRPEAAGWSATTKPESPTTVQVTSNGRRISTIELDAGHLANDIAVRPPTELQPVPLVAIASHKTGEPRLQVYDARDGTAVREFTGHFGRINGIAFSADGRLLASCAEDRTVCVWLVSDLAETTLGKIGFLNGLTLKPANKIFKVEDVKSGSSSAAVGLAVGDVIDGISRDGQLLKFESLFDFYDEVSRVRPGTRVTLQVSRDGKSMNRPVQVDQGIDERKPLFSLFLFPNAVQGAAGEPTRYSWIGWHPIGPYDAGDRDAESNLGWHFNTGEPHAPTRFAAADQYRRRNFRHGLLAELVEHGRLPLVRATQQPEASLIFVRAGGQPLSIYEEESFISAALESAAVEVNKFPANLIETVQWRFQAPQAAAAPNAKKPEPLFDMKLQEEHWTADLSGVTWKRGDNRLFQVVLQTREFPPRELVVAEHRLSFVPPAPELKLASPADGLTATRDEQTQVLAKVSADKSSGPATVVLQVRGKEHKRWSIKPGEALQIAEPVTLTAGDNEIRLLATNDDALPTTRDMESSFGVGFVNYTPRIENPAFAWQSVIELPGKQTVAMQPGLAFITQSPRVRINGTIQSMMLLESATVRRFKPDAADAKPVTGFNLPDLTKEQRAKFAVSESFVLQPGLQTIRFEAASQGGGMAISDIRFEYRPPTSVVRAPQIHVGKQTLEIRPGRSLSVVPADKQDAARLTVDLGHVPDRQPFEAVVLVNGREQRTVAITDQTSIDVPLELGVGRNQVSLRFRNQWKRDDEVVSPVTVRMRQPPEVTVADVTRPPEHTVGKLTGLAVSPVHLPLTVVHVTVNGSRLPRDLVTVNRSIVDPPAREARVVDRWTFEVDRVPLVAGRNRISVVAENADGASTALVKTLEVVLPPPKTSVDFVGLDLQGVKTAARNFPLGIRVHPTGKLQRIDLTVDHPELGTRRIELLNENALTRRGADVVLNQLVQLDEGLNHVKLEVFDDEGRASTQVVPINVVPAPASIVVDGIVSKLAPNVVLQPEQSEDGITFRDAAADGHIRLRGRVTAAAKFPVPHNSFVRVWVNGFLQTTKLNPDGAFECPVLLNSTTNQLRIEAPDLAVETLQGYIAKNVSVQCKAPETRQQLHMLVVGVSNPDEKPVDSKELKKRGESALRLQAGNQAFSATRIYGPLVGEDADAGQIRLRMLEIRFRIRNRAFEDRVNDVIMVYFQTKETLLDDSRFVLADTGHWKSPELFGDSLITSDWLANYFQHTPGAHLLCLDVESKSRTAKLSDKRMWPRLPNVGLMRVVRAEGEQLVLISALDAAFDANTQWPAKELQLRPLEQLLQAKLGNRTLDFRVPEDLGTMIIGRIK